jgi:hypothetical protein
MVCIPSGLIFRVGFSPSFVCNISKTRALEVTAYPLFAPETLSTPSSATVPMDVIALVAAASGLFTGDKPLAPLTASIQITDPPKDADRALMWNHQDTHPLPPVMPCHALTEVSDRGSHHDMSIDGNMMTAERDAILCVINDGVLYVCFLSVFPEKYRWGPTLAQDKYESLDHFR